MVYSYKSVLLLGILSISGSSYLYLVSPLFFEISNFDDYYTFLSLMFFKTNKSVYEVNSSVLYWLSFDDSLSLSSSDYSLIDVHFIWTTGAIWFNYLNFLSNLVSFIFFFMLLDSVLFNFLFTNKSNLWFKLSNLLKSSFFLSYLFFTSFDTVLSFSYFFISLYFLEVHFFFVFSLNLSSDTLIFQFNFLLASFIFIFIFKLLKVTFVNGGFFSLNFNFNELFVFFNQKKTTQKLYRAGFILEESSISPAKFYTTVKFTLTFLYFIFYFLSTFFVWSLRYCIQFIRLLVLFMIHAIFELAIVSSDSYFIHLGLNGLFWIKYIFFIFLYFSLFFYLIIYLNLMFTLQIFIFYFFSEVFQSNLMFDLSSFILVKTKLV